LETAQDFLPAQGWVESVGYRTEWVKVVERAQLKVVQLRLREGQGRTSGRQTAPTEVDELFPVRFVGPDGSYQAGTIANAEKAKLPANAVAVVQQLLLWMPEDTRLYWLLGELYNARGELEAADRVFEECVGPRRAGTPGLREHRRLVKEALAARTPPPAPPAEDWRPSTIRLVVVGLIGGAIFAGLVCYQVVELLRRRQSVRPPAAGG
jgi:hypothetical protein